MYGKQSYLHLGENIDVDKYIITEFYVESDKSILEVAEALAAESSIGTWTDLSTMDADIMTRLGARIFYANEEEHIVKIAYPLGLFEAENIPQLLSDVAGNVFGMNEIINLRVRDIIFPKAYLRTFDGPAFGISGIRKLLGIPERPLLGTIIKPKVGLDADRHASVAFDAWVGGVQVVKDDENLSNQSFNPFEERVVKTLAMLRKAEDITGEKKMYVPNISAQASDMLKRAEFVKAQGGIAVMMDILTVGFAGVQYIRDQNTGLVLHGHRAMHGAFTHSTKHGIAMLPIAKTARICGIDQLHTGTIIGKMHGGEEEVSAINNAMRCEWGNLKKTMPIASGGVHPGLLQKMIELIGNDVIINLGGGIHGHPDGTKSGAIAASQAVDASIAKIDLNEYAKDHKELQRAIDKWGVYKDESLLVPKNNSLITYTYGLTEGLM
ncbi:ribulose-bisphosphate carboxylase large subunit [Candidatus Dojkabacteria bacterium]|nr:ribulose-bisphosphate carboxylase large subunit [Candidatus Dojkabacteria bacterium]